MISRIIDRKFNISFQAKTINLNKIPKIQEPKDVFESRNIIQIVRKKYNYSSKSNSILLEPYTGNKKKTAGFSTEAFDSLAGGYLTADLNVPLSTTGVRTCAVLNLVNQKENKHFLYHVYHGTTPDLIKGFLLEKFPSFDKVNIFGGEIYQTIETIRRVIFAVNNINPKATKHFYEAVSYTPEVVAHEGKLKYMKGKENTASFSEVIVEPFC